MHSFRRFALPGTLLATVATAGLVAAGSPALATTAGSPAAKATCRPVPAQVVGVNSSYRPGARAGVYLWHINGKGAHWALRVTHPGRGLQVFTGTVRAARPMSFRPYRLERGDRVWLAPNRRTLHFRFANFGREDGVNFTDHCSVNTRFTFQRDWREMNPRLVFLGSRGVHPTSNPFDVQRSRR